LGGISVNLDPGLMAEMETLEKANQALPAAAVPAASPATAPATTGPRTADAAAKRAHATPAAARALRGTGESAGRGSGAHPAGKGRLSGVFSAIEADFFARESELYKQEASDNFADLDDPAGKPSGPRKGAKKR
jgi:hypothetical protein